MIGISGLCETNVFDLNQVFLTPLDINSLQGIWIPDVKVIEAWER